MRVKLPEPELPNRDYAGAVIQQQRTRARRPLVEGENKPFPGHGELPRLSGYETIPTPS
jgi:hypothetical protein